MVLGLGDELIIRFDVEEAISSYPSGLHDPFDIKHSAWQARPSRRTTSLGAALHRMTTRIPATDATQTAHDGRSSC